MAHKKAGGSVKNGRDSVGQRLGVKAGDGQLVTAGSIIVRQRGMTFLAGPGTGLGKDYTVFATVDRQGEVRARDQGQEAHPGRGGREPPRRAPRARPGSSRRPPAGTGPARTASEESTREARHPSQVLPGQGPLRLVRHASGPSAPPATSCASTSAATATRSSRASRTSSTPPARSSASRSASSARSGADVPGRPSAAARTHHRTTGRHGPVVLIPTYPIRSTRTVRASSRTRSPSSVPAPATRAFAAPAPAARASCAAVARPLGPPDEQAGQERVAAADRVGAGLRRRTDAPGGPVQHRHGTGDPSVMTAASAPAAHHRRRRRRWRHRTWSRWIRCTSTASVRLALTSHGSAARTAPQAVAPPSRARSHRSRPGTPVGPGDAGEPRMSIDGGSGWQAA